VSLSTALQVQTWAIKLMQAAGWMGKMIYDKIAENLSL
jgi:hypothetical protein